MSGIIVRPVVSKADKKAFVELAYRLNLSDPNWVPPLKGEVRALITPGKNPWFEHGEAAFFLAERGGTAEPVGRISAQVDQLVLQHMGAGLGQWGMFEAEDVEVARALLAAAEDWLRARGMSRSMGPFSLGIWDEPGLLIHGHDHPPMVMMGHDKCEYQGWIEGAGYAGVKDLYTYDVPSDRAFPPLIGRIIASGERNQRIRIRRVDKSRFDEEAALLMSILNEAWADNWGFVPLTDSEIAYAGRKLKPIVLEELILVAEVAGGAEPGHGPSTALRTGPSTALGTGPSTALRTGPSTALRTGFEPVAFMMGLPDVNEFLMDLKGELFPFGWAKLLWRLKRMRPKGGRVPLMGVVSKLHGTRLASQLAFMMIEYIRRAGYGRYGITRAEIGWILDDNAPMLSIAEAIESRRNRTYRIYERPL